jgi:MerR family transcriptional regulator/heat shock protein HspR
MKKRKGYFSISAVSHMLNIHQQTIRMYEKSGFIQPKRSDGNTRMFSDEDILILEQIIYYTNKLGVNLAGVEIILKMQKRLEKIQKNVNLIFSKSQEELTVDRQCLEQQLSDAHKEIKKIEKFKKTKLVITENSNEDENNEK